jgi:membrane fusion protein, heavy metal efflux system
VFTVGVILEPLKMKARISPNQKTVIVALAVLVLATVTALLKSESGQGKSSGAPAKTTSTSNGPTSLTTVELSSDQLNTIKIEPVGSHLFPVERDAVGNIDFDEDLSVQVFPAYQGTILKTFGELGARVQKDQPLYTIKSPDLIQAESTLIGAAATLELTSKELTRAKELEGTSGVSIRELEQATSDEQTAEGALKAARDAVLVFGKTDAEIDQMIALPKIDPALVVRSPISGKVTYKVAQPGFLVQPGNVPAPYSVADVTIKWMLANVSEADVPLFHLGQPVQVKVMALPDHVFRGKVSKIYETVDPNTHRVTIRSEITDHNDELRPGMLANFTIQIQNPVEATAIPANGVVREADGTMTAWVTTDRHRFDQRIIKIGLRNDDQVQVLDGLRRGELVVADGAVFLSNMLQPAPSD